MKRYVVGLDPFSAEASLIVCEVELTTDGLTLKPEDTKEYRAARRILLLDAEDGKTAETYNLHKTRLDALIWYYTKEATEKTALTRKMSALDERINLAERAISSEMRGWPRCPRCGKEMMLVEGDWQCGYCCGDPNCEICV